MPDRKGSYLVSFNNETVPFKVLNGKVVVEYKGQIKSAEIGGDAVEFLAWLLLRDIINEAGADQN